MALPSQVRGSVLYPCTWTHHYLVFKPKHMHTLQAPSHGSQAKGCTGQVQPSCRTIPCGMVPVMGLGLREPTGPAGASGCVGHLVQVNAWGMLCGVAHECMQETVGRGRLWLAGHLHGEVFGQFAAPEAPEVNPSRAPCPAHRDWPQKARAPLGRQQWSAHPIHPSTLLHIHPP